MQTVPEGFVPLPLAGDAAGYIGVNGPLYVRHEGARLSLGFRVEPRHANPLGICHGGMLATFCDMLLPITILRTRADLGMRFLPTISLQLDYLAPARLGAWVQGEAEVLRVTRSFVFAQGLVSADGEVAVRTSGICKIGPPFPGGGDGAG